MKKINAVWEKRNLGISCVELEIAEQDPIEAIEEELKKISADYMVVKAPIGRFDIYQILNECGFSYIETMFQIEKKIEESLLKSHHQILAEDMTYKIDEPESLSRVIDEINRGMFTTDRISLDPFFSQEQVNKRYIGMIQDELDRGAELMEFYYRSVPFGFACFRRKSDDLYYQCLTGLYHDERGKGKGFALAYLPNKELLQRGVKRLSGAVSTNNTASLQAHLKIGFYPVETSYTFVKHSSVAKI